MSQADPTEDARLAVFGNGPARWYRAPVMDPDLSLLERWRAGDRGAGEELFARHFAEIYRFFEHKLGAEADDLVQRTFLACVSARDQFRAQSTFRTYLFAIARNELHGYLRRLPQGERVDLDSTSIAAIVSSPSRRLDRARQSEVLRACLRDLPVEQQLLLELHYWHELDAAALGEIVGAAPGTVRVRLLRARAALRERMAQVAPGSLAAVGASTDRLAASLSSVPQTEGDLT
jgi:RNA polymerase sigma factor (sigma-70 family)